MYPLSLDFRAETGWGTARDDQISRNETRVYLNKIGQPFVFLPDVSSELLRQKPGLLRALAFLRALSVKAFDFVFRPQNLNTEHTEKDENTEAELDSK
jgi:hypothetical protein